MEKQVLQAIIDSLPYETQGQKNLLDIRFKWNEMFNEGLEILVTKKVLDAYNKGVEPNWDNIFAGMENTAWIAPLYEDVILANCVRRNLNDYATVRWYIVEFGKFHKEFSRSEWKAASKQLARSVAKQIAQLHKLAKRRSQVETTFVISTATVDKAEVVKEMKKNLREKIKFFNQFKWATKKVALMEEELKAL